MSIIFSTDFTVEKGTLVHARDDVIEPGRVVGTKYCGLSGCRGLRLGVRWPNGKLTWPCTKGMDELEDGSWMIL